MKTIQGDLILEDDTTFHEPLKVEGNILGKDGKRFSLTVHGNITAGNITARNITARNITADDITAGNITAMDIDAGDITAMDIDAGDITAMDIDAGDITALCINAWGIVAGDIDAANIICESRKKKDPNNKTMTGIFITNRSTFKRKNWELEA
jgi:hypothetical protein